jgi:hypothetical protein
MHAFDHHIGMYSNFGVTLTNMPSSARAMLEVRAYQMQRWLSGGQFIEDEDEVFYKMYYRQAKELDTNYNFIIKDYPIFFKNIQK